MTRKTRQTFQTARDWISRFDKPLSVLAGAAVLTAILLNFEFNLLEAKLYDFRISRSVHPKPDPDIVLVTIDDRSTRELSDYAPFPLDLHVRFLEQLESKLEQSPAQPPKAIGYLVNMNYVNQINPDLFNGEWGQRFVEAARKLESRGSPVIMGTPFDVNGEILPPYPLSSLQHAIAIIHKDGNVFAGDKVTRRAMTYLYEKPTFHVLMSDGQRPSGSFAVPEIDGEYFFFRYHGDLSNWENDANYARVSFSDVLAGKVDPGFFSGKRVLVGTLNHENPGDFATTPFSSGSLGYPKILIHANILDSILNDHSILLTPSWVNALATFLVTSLVFWAVLGLSPLYGVFATFGLAAGFFLLGILTFQGAWGLHSIWIQQSQPLVGIFLGYYLIVPYRLIREYRKRWNYQKRNELLTQVEQLKTNFLSLVTHDLKTPVARIQGLAEVLLKKSGATLADPDRRTLLNIIASTDELNRFISSILELSKVESTELRPNLESKDINLLIERAVDGFQAQARSKRIRISANLEPLFPVRIDPSLISKVLNNLIDNALKYSPVGSEVVIESRELHDDGDWIEISVRDQGIGLSEEERSQLFTKFYRVQSSSESQIGGSGLGLYLTKYFIEAHHGTVTVESEKNRGSVFKIRLPADLAAPVSSAHPGLAQSTNSNPTQKERTHV